MRTNYIHVPKTGGMSIKAICDNNSALVKYNNHHVDIFNPQISNRLLVLRNPIDRFISSVKHLTSDWDAKTHLPIFINRTKIRIVHQLKERGISLADNWIEILRDENHTYNETLLFLLKNNENISHIGPYLCEYNFLFEPQSSWHIGEFSVIMFDNFEEEVKRFFKVDKVPKVNSSKPNPEETISKKNIEWLKEIYAKDFETYYNYCDTTYNRRILNGL